MRTKLVVLVSALALGLLGTWTAPAQADGPSRAFRGTVSGTVHFEPTTDPACTVAPFVAVSEATGHGTHFGRVSMESTHCAGNTIAGTMTFTGRRGSVTFDYQGDCTPFPPAPPYPDEVTCDTEMLVTGGTGRFEDAEGAGRMLGVVHPDLSIPNPLVGTWPGTWTWQGRISY